MVYLVSGGKIVGNCMWIWVTLFMFAHICLSRHTNTISNPFTRLKCWLLCLCNDKFNEHNPYYYIYRNEKLVYISTMTYIKMTEYIYDYGMIIKLFKHCLVRWLYDQISTWSILTSHLGSNLLTFHTKKPADIWSGDTH